MGDMYERCVVTLRLSEVAVSRRGGLKRAVLALACTTFLLFVLAQGSSAQTLADRFSQDTLGTFAPSNDHPWAGPPRVSGLGPQILTGSTDRIGVVSQTLDLANDSLFSGNYLPISCTPFTDVAIAPSLQRVFVTCMDTNALIAFNSSTGIIDGSVLVGPSPEGLVFDPENDRVYVADTGGSVSVVAARNMTLVDSISVGCSPYDVAYDNASQQLYVSDCNDVTVISTTNNSVTTRVALGSGAQPWGIIYDAYNRDVYVAESALDLVGVISTTNNTLIASIGVSGQLRDFACDPVTGTVYVAVWLSQQLAVISGVTQSVVKTLNLPGYPYAIGLDPDTHRIYLATENLGAGNVTVVNSSSLTIVGFVSVGVGPVGIAIDNASGLVYVADSSSNDVAAINESTLSVVGFFRGDPEPFGVTWNSVGQSVYVTNQASGTLDQVNGRTNAIVSSTLLANGLTGVSADITTGHLFVGSPANGGVYDVNANGTLQSFTSVQADPIALAYDSDNGDVYVANNLAVGYYVSDTVSVINGTNGSLVESISVSPSGLIPGGLEDIAFDPNNGDLYVAVEGCSCSSPGNVTIIDGATNQVVGGIYDWGEPGPSALAVDTQNNELYVTDQFADLLWAFNATTDSLISTTPVGAVPEGLAVDSQNGYIYVSNSGSNNVSVINSSTNRVIGSIPVGLTPWGVAVDSASGDIYVANQDSGTLSIISTALYSVLFQERGLPSATGWSVTLEGFSNASVTSSIGFIEFNGTYHYTITGIPGWRLVSFPRIGLLTVNGSSLTEVVNWTATTYSVEFTERGLPGGAVWNVTLAGVPRSSNATNLSFVVANDSYSFLVGSPSGYTVHPSNGSLLVNGSNVTESLTFTKSASQTFLGLPVWEGYGLVVVVVVAAGLIAAFQVIRVRRRKQPSSEPALPP